MIGWFLTTRLGRSLAWLLAALAAISVALLKAYRKGKSDANRDTKERELTAKVKTWERINEADTSTGDDAADRKWLAARGVRGAGKSDRDL
jgi:hypothetical protein